jgi:ABC-type Fe3+-siderophore transport system permease subunit
MTAGGMAIFAVSGALLAVVLRNIFGGPTRKGIVAGRAAMLAFAALAAYFLFAAHQGKVGRANPESILAAQRLMIGCVLAMILSAYSVGVQRRKLRAQAAAGKPEPPPS